MIHLYPPSINKKALKYFKQCVSTGWVSTGGNLINKFERKIEKITGVKHAIACNSGTSALHISIKLSGISPGDEIIAPTLTFVATINTIIYNACNPVFMDCDKYYNIDAKKTLEFLRDQTFKKNNCTYNKKTKRKISALVVTHVWGNAVDIDKLVKECKLKNIKIIEDASESFGSRYKNGEHTGTKGLFGAISFNSNKIITTGCGGIILTNNLKLANKARYLTTQAKDDPINFVHNEIGYNYRMTNISAALGLSQLEQFKFFLKKKEIIRNYYLSKIKKINNFELADTPQYSENNNWMNILKIKNTKKINKNKLIKNFLKNKIIVRPIWKLNHLQKPFKKFQNYKISNALDLVDRSLCLPSYPSLSVTQLNKIISKLNG